MSEGDRIRYRQAPGGILPASAVWTYGVAVPYKRFGEDSLCLEDEAGRQYNLVGHIIERVSPDEME